MNKLSLKKLIDKLPECYQPIYAHEELSQKTSRLCKDRFKEIKKIYAKLEKIKKRPLKVLDLGCAQGFFCFSLAELGAEVTGIDFLDKNVDVCNEIKKETNNFKVNFIHEKIENILSKIKPGDYDIFLGLSVFHHLIHENGLDYVKELISKTLENISIGLFELALKEEEDYYWSKSLPLYPTDSFDNSSFFNKIGCFKTHLTNIKRPLYFCSKDFWYLNNTLEKIDSFSKSPHKMESNPHKNSRRYFSSKKAVIKHFLFTHQERGEHNKKELLNEISFFKKYAFISDFKLIDSTVNKHYGIIVLEKVEGFLLSDFISENKRFDEEKIIKGILKKASILENKGLYHNDIRSWNILIDKSNHPILIDYGSISEEKKDCTWPQNIYLSFFIFVNELSSKNIESPTPIKQLKLRPFSLPEKYRNWCISLWKTPIEKWSFKLMLDKLEEEKVSSLEPDNQINLTFFKEIEDAVNHVKKLSNQIESLLNEKKELLNSLSKTEAWGKDLEKQKFSLNEHIKNTEAWGKDLEKQIFSLNEHIKNKDLWIERLEKSWEEQKNLIDKTNKELKSVYNSISWKITLFLRVFSSTVSKATICAKQFIKFLLSKLFIHISKKPKIKNYVIKIGNKMPQRIQQKFRKFYRINVLGLVPAEHTDMNNCELTANEKLIKEIITETLKV